MVLYDEIEHRRLPRYIPGFGRPNYPRDGPRLATPATQVLEVLALSWSLVHVYTQQDIEYKKGTSHSYTCIYKTIY